MMGEIAIAHKDYDVRGGGEILAEELARTFDAPLYVGHANEDNHPDQPDIDIHEIAPESRWHWLMDKGGAPRGIGHMMHWRDNAPEALADYETIVTSGNEPLWAMTRDEQTVVAYTHSTPRWMYDLYHDSEGFVGRTYQQVQRRLYEGTVKRPDLWVANSELIARRINKYWNIPEEQIRVVYPPVPTHEYDPALEPGDYYLYLGRLAGHKRVEDVVKAFDQLDRDPEFKSQLIVAGKGPEREHLETIAANTTEFAGFVSEQRKRELYAGAKALIYPAQNEDFGMVPIEAMAAGTPVIGVNEGFTKYQIQDGKNGYTYVRKGGHLRECIRGFERNGVMWTSEEIAAFARANFSVEQFHKGMQAAVEDARDRAAVDADLTQPVGDPDAQPVETVADGGGGA